MSQALRDETTYIGHAWDTDDSVLIANHDAPELAGSTFVPKRGIITLLPTRFTQSWLNSNYTSANYSIAQSEETDFSEVDNMYTYISERNAREAKHFIEEHPYLKPVLLEAPQYIFASFGVSELVLRLQHDSETGTQKLKLFIKTQLPVREAFASLDRVRLDWLIQQSKATRESFFVTIQRRPQ